jgi:hypothetical protein
VRRKIGKAAIGGINFVEVNSQWRSLQLTVDSLPHISMLFLKSLRQRVAAIDYRLGIAVAAILKASSDRNFLA